MSANTETPWHQSTLLWGCVGAVLTIVLTVVAAMIKDLRFLLIVAWPFAIIAGWEFARAANLKRVRFVTIIGAAFSALMLLGLDIYLKPNASENALAIASPITVPGAQPASPPAATQEFAFDVRLARSEASDAKEIVNQDKAILRVRSRYPGILTGINMKILDIDPPGPFALTPPIPVSAAPHNLNPMDWFEIGLASYDTLPSPWTGLRYNATGGDAPDHYGNDRSYDYTLYITAAESLPATVHVRVWLENGNLHVQSR
jgi:hypothetical protein